MTVKVLPSSGVVRTYGHRGAVGFGYRHDDAQAEARAAATGGAGGVAAIEALEDPAGGVGVHAGALVGDVRLDVGGVPKWQPSPHPRRGAVEAPQ